MMNEVEPTEFLTLSKEQKIEVHRLLKEGAPLYFLYIFSFRNWWKTSS